MTTRSRRGAGGTRTRPVPAQRRDTVASSFTPILLDFVARVPGATGAVLVDGEGEAVDYAGRADPYALKLTGAHWQIVLRELVSLAERCPIGTPRALAVRGERRSFIAHTLPDAYALVLLLGRRAGFAAATRAFSVCERALAIEAGWEMTAPAPRWFAVDVSAGRAGRPARIRDGAAERSLEIVGRIAGLAPRENGWRVRFDHGAELTLVREPGGHWYADEAVGPMFAGRPAALA